MTEKTFLIPESTRQAIAQYLVERPWREVDPLIRALMTLDEAKAANSDEEKILADNGYFDN